MTDHPGGLAFAELSYPPPEWHFCIRLEKGIVLSIATGCVSLSTVSRNLTCKRWLHVSVSRKKWIPSHEDMCLAKQAFIGDRYAYAVYPPRDKYVNIHQNCLHLWALAEGDGRVLPEFSAELDGIGVSV